MLETKHSATDIQKLAFFLLRFCKPTKRTKGTRPVAPGSQRGRILETKHSATDIQKLAFFLLRFCKPTKRTKGTRPVAPCTKRPLIVFTVSFPSVLKKSAASPRRRVEILRKRFEVKIP